jgi:hypothetical protein
MRLRLFSILLWLAPTPALAAGVTFSGTILDSCTLALSSAGALDVSTDGTMMGSEIGTGRAAKLTILSTGSHAIQVAAPTRSSPAPTGYNAATEQVEVAYAGESLLSSISQPYTSSSTSFNVGTVALTTLDVNSRIINPSGFAGGTYTTQTVVTCN